MHVISRKKIREFLAAHPSADPISLDRWYKTAKKARWNHFADVRSDFPSADLVGDLVVFNVGGNKYRLIAEIKYRYQEVYLRHVLTHAEYDKGRWKKGE